MSDDWNARTRQDLGNCERCGARLVDQIRQPTRVSYYSVNGWAEPVMMAYTTTNVPCGCVQHGDM